jgi:exodeoxyribonuclease VII large subunit
VPDAEPLELWPEEPEAEPEPEAERPSPLRQQPRPKSWSVSQVNRAVRQLLEETVEPLWVSGEVANWTRARSGHCYFTLKDEKAQLRCAMFRAEAQMLPIDPDEGMTVRAFGRLTLYEGRGEFQLVARRLEGDGAEGLWRLAFEKLRAKLDAEGLLDPELRRPLPRFPSRIGVVTSPTGAALRDILSVVRRRAPWTSVLLRGSRVQGEGAAEEIAAAIRVLGRPEHVDVLIVGRGGGSIEDLWAFNEEPVARAIAECPVPVISAVGHEVDVTIADLVADLRAPTPSAAGEAVVPDGEEMVVGLTRVELRLRSALTSSVQRRAKRLSDASRRLGLGAQRLVRPRREQLKWAHDRISRAVQARVGDARSHLGGLAATMDVLSPLSTLRRGYAIPLGEEGQILRSVGEFEAGVEFSLRVADGSVSCESRGPVHGPDD